MELSPQSSILVPTSTGKALIVAKHTGPDNVVIGKQFSSTKVTLPNGQHVKLPPGRYKYKTASVNGRRGILLHNVDKLATINKKLFIPTTVEVDTKKHRMMAGGGKFSSEKLTDLTGTKLTVPNPLPDKTESTMKSPPLNTSTKTSASNDDTRQSTELLSDDNDVIYVSGDENYDTESLTVDVSDVDVVDESGDYVQKNILSPKAGMEEVVERISVPKSLLEHDSENISSIQQPKPLACFLNKNMSSEQPQRSNVTTNVSSTDTVVTKQTDLEHDSENIASIQQPKPLACFLNKNMSSEQPQRSNVTTNVSSTDTVVTKQTDLEHDSENIASIQQPKPLACFLNKNMSSEQSQRSNVTTNVSLTDTVVTKQTDKMVMNPGLSSITNTSSVLTNLASQMSDQMTSNVPSNNCVFTTLGNISPVFSTSSDSASPDTTMTASPKQFSDFPNMSKTELLTQYDFSQFNVSPPKGISTHNSDSIPETESISRSVTPVTSDCMRIPITQFKTVPKSGAASSVKQSPLNTTMPVPNYSQSTVDSYIFSTASVTRPNNSTGTPNNSTGTIITSPTSGGIEKVFIPPNMRSKFDSSLSVTSHAPITVTKLPTVFSKIVTTATMTSSNNTKPSSSKPIISSVPHKQTIHPILVKPTTLYSPPPNTYSILYSNPVQKGTQHMHSYNYPSSTIPQLPLCGASTVIVPVPSVPSTKYYQVKYTPMNVLNVTNSTPNSYSIIGPGLQYPIYRAPQTVSVASTQVVNTKQNISPVYTSPSWDTPITQAGKPSTNVTTKEIPPSRNSPMILQRQVPPQSHISSTTPIITVDATDSSGPKQYFMVNVPDHTTEPGKVSTFKRILVPMSSFNVLPKDAGNTKTTTVHQVRQQRQNRRTVLRNPRPFLGRPSLGPPPANTPKTPTCHASLPEKYPPLHAVPVTLVTNVSKQPYIISTNCASKPVSAVSSQGIPMTAPKLVSQSKTIPNCPYIDNLPIVNSSSIKAWLNSRLNRSAQQSTPTVSQSAQQSTPTPTVPQSAQQATPTVSQSAQQSTPTLSGNKAAVYKYTPLFLTSSTTVTSSTKPTTSTQFSTRNKYISLVNIPQTAPRGQSHLEKYLATIRVPVKTTPNKPSSLPVSLGENPDSSKENIPNNKSNDPCPNVTHNRILSEDKPSTLSLHKDEPPMLLREEPSTEDLGENQDACMPLLEPVIESPNTENNLQKLTGKTDPILVESLTESDLDPYSALRSLLYKNKSKPTIPLDPRQFPSVKDAASINNDSDTSDLGIKIESVYSLKKPESTNNTEPTAPKRPRWVGNRSKIIIDDRKLMKHPNALPTPQQCCNKKTNAFVVLERSKLFSEPVNVRKIRKLKKRRACDLICRTAALRLLCHNGLLKPHQFDERDPKPDTGQVESCSVDANTSPNDVIIPKKKGVQKDIEGGANKTVTKRKYTKNPQAREKKVKLSKKHVSENKGPDRQLYDKFVHLPQEDKQFFTLTSGDKNLLIPVKQNIFYPRSYIYGDGDICFDMIPKNRLYALLDYHSKAIETEERQKIYKLSSSAVRRMFASDTLHNDTTTVIRCHEIEARFENQAGEMIDLTQTCISSAGITEQTTDHTTKADGVLQQSSALSTASYIDAFISENTTKVAVPVSDPISAMETINTTIVESYANDGVDLTLQTNTNLLDQLSTDMVQRTVTYEASETIRDMKALEMELTMNATNEASLESENGFDIDESLAPVSSNNQGNLKDILVPNDRENISQVNDMFNSPESPTNREIPSNSQVDAHTEEMVSLLSNTPEPAEDVESLQSVIKQQEAELMKLKKWIKKNSVNLDEIDDF